MHRFIEKYKKMPVTVRASIWFMFCTFMQKGISVLTTPIFTRLLTTTEYGMYGVFDSWMGIITIFVGMRLYYGVYLQGLVKFSEDRNVFSSSLQGLTLTLTVAWTIIYFLFRDFWNRVTSLTTVQMMAGLVMIWATAAFNFWAGEQRTQYKYRTLVGLTIAISIAKPVLSIILIKNAQDKVTARILGITLAELIGYTGLFITQMRRGKKFYSAKYWKYALMFNLPLIPHYLSQTVLASSDRIMIEKMIGASEAGIYGLAYKLSNLMIMVNTALNQTLTPWLYSKIKEKQLSDLSRISVLSLSLVCGMNLAMIAIAPEALTVFAPSTYSAAVYCIPPVSMSVIFTFSYELFAKFEFYYEKTGWIMTASVIAAGANLLLNYIFIPIFGYAAAAYTTLFCYMIYTGAHYTMMNRVCKSNDLPKPYNGKLILMIYGVFLVSGFLLMGTYSMPMVRYGLIIIAIAAAIWKRRSIKKIVSELTGLRKKKKRPAAQG